jgi:hypothetical protein
MMKAIEAALVQRPAPWDRIDSEPPMRLVMFLTDGYVGNDNEIIEAVRSNAGTTRVFSFGIGNSVNRHLMEGMARAGRGEVEFVLAESDADAAVDRFTRRVATPVLTHIVLEVEGVEVTDTIPPLDAVPDLFDEKLLIIHGRYTRPGRGSLTISGRTGAGRYERRLDLDLPEDAPDHDVIGTLWARARVDELTPAGDPRPIIALGEQFQIMTEYTSFVAVEKSRMTIDGKPMLVAVPIEMPDGVSYEGIFGGAKDATEGDVNGRTVLLGDMPMLGEIFEKTDATAHNAQFRYLTTTEKSVGLAGQLAAGLPSAVEDWLVDPGDGSPMVLTVDRDQMYESLDMYFDTRTPVPETVLIEACVWSSGFKDGDGGEIAGDADEISVIVLPPTPTLVTRDASDLVDRSQEVHDEDQPGRSALDREFVLRLARVLDQRLWPLVPVLAAHATDAADALLPRLRGEIVVSLLIADRTPETLAVLTEHGLTIEARSGSINHVVGTIAPDRLADLALLKAVRRIEPVNWD